MGVKIYSEEWPIIAGLIGLVKLVGNNVEIQNDGVLVHAESLGGLAKKYFDTLLTTHNRAEKRIEDFEKRIGYIKANPSNLKKYLDVIVDDVGTEVKKINKYFAGTKEHSNANIALDMLKEAKKKKTDNKLELIEEAFNIYKDVLYTPFINEKITLNYIKAVILAPIYGQTSFLQRSFTFGLEEHIERMERDIVRPAMLEIKSMDCLRDANDPEDIVVFLEKNQEDYQPFKRWLRGIKKKETVDEVREYFANEIVPCFFTGTPATQTLEEKSFGAIGVSADKAVNFFWDFNNKEPLGLSALARLVLFLIPLGMAFHWREIKTKKKTGRGLIWGLVLSQQTFPTILNTNMDYQELRKGKNTFEAITGVLGETTDKAKKIKKEYTFLEFYCDIDSKKTVLDYYHMPSYLVEYFSRYGKTLTLLHDYDLQDNFIKSVLKGIDPKGVLFSYIRKAIDEPYHAEGAYHASRERMRILNAKKGVEKVSKYDFLVTKTYEDGKRLRDALMGLSEKDSEDRIYRASDEKKIAGYAYRLINASKSGDKQIFMDTIFRLYLSTKNLKVPSIFIDSFKDAGLDFETISTAFVAGMLSQEKVYKKKQEEGVNNG